MVLVYIMLIDRFRLAKIQNRRGRNLVNVLYQWAFVKAQPIQALILCLVTIHTDF